MESGCFFSPSFSVRSWVLKGNGVNERIVPSCTTKCKSFLHSGVSDGAAEPEDSERVAVDISAREDTNEMME